VADLSGWENEAGGHRVQRVPRTERNGRVHSSTVTVSVLPDTGQGAPLSVPEADLHLEWYSGSGAGGQHRNKHQNSARLRHLPTGIVVTAQCRKREALLDRLRALSEGEAQGRENRARADQVGTGMRADKRRTYRFRDDRVQDHLTGRSAACSAVMRGRFDLLWA
jgi:protein subunit release factor A